MLQLTVTCLQRRHATLEAILILLHPCYGHRQLTEFPRRPLLLAGSADWEGAGFGEDNCDSGVGLGYLLGAQPPSARTLELWDAASALADAGAIEATVMNWLLFLPLLFSSDGEVDMSMLILDILEV